VFYGLGCCALLADGDERLEAEVKDTFQHRRQVLTGQTPRHPASHRHMELMGCRPSVSEMIVFVPSDESCISRYSRTALTTGRVGSGQLRGADLLGYRQRLDNISLIPLLLSKTGTSIIR
jgi:hypothetical protein